MFCFFCLAIALKGNGGSLFVKKFFLTWSTCSSSELSPWLSSGLLGVCKRTAVAHYFLNFSQLATPRLTDTARVSAVPKCLAASAGEEVRNGFKALDPKRNNVPTIGGEKIHVFCGTRYRSRCIDDCSSADPITTTTTSTTEIYPATNAGSMDLFLQMYRPLRSIALPG